MNNGGYNNWDSSGSISLQSVIFNGNNGVFVGNGGTVQVLGPYTGNDSDHFVWENNNSKGTVYHNNGTIQFGGVGHWRLAKHQKMQLTITIETIIELLMVQDNLVTVTVDIYTI